MIARAAIRLMEERRVRRVPVVSPDGVLVGIVAMADLARTMGDDKAVGELLEEVSEPEPSFAGPK